ncbi:hypothetical protein Clacol_010047 [Clathrus columnatus]|uniref:ERG4/ERG24 ergosterol biosynthesis protein n=1 Tax=Clathrus columnatus TaxID=1419009 RepID=A0AAV5ARJ7_9AGAM|nr:hypothetical protein Clacol_010047 [Clathrus columnatus]
MTTVSKLNPRTQHYEFGGPFGAAFVTLSVPITTYALYFGCSETSGGCPPPLSDIPIYFINAITSLDWWKSLWDTEAFLAYLAWYTFTVVAWYVLPGDWIEGVPLRDGTKKKYKINAFSTFLLTLGLAAGAILRFGPTALTFVYEHWIGLTTSSIIMATVQAIYVYVASFEEGKLLALGGNSGNLIYDFYIGRELNPSIGSFDIKSFNELRPGLILWALIDIAMACEQATRLGGKITDSMLLVLIFQIWYIGDGLYNEVYTSFIPTSPIAENPIQPAIFTTMDITTDGFGFMLSIGDLAWVPMVYSLQARYLVFNQVELGTYLSLAVFVLHGAGYYIFRSANGEKNDFRNGRNPKSMAFLLIT